MKYSNSKHFLAVHWIQTLPVSNPNRDRAGAPKTTYYGGSMRGRISSQSWGRQVRELFNEKWEGDAGLRSRLWANRMAEALQEKLEYNRIDSLTVAFLMLMGMGVKPSTAETFKAGQTNVLLFFSDIELRELIAIAQRYQPQLEQALALLRPIVAESLNQGKVPSLEAIGSKKKKKKAEERKEEETKQESIDLSNLHKEVARAVIESRPSADIALFGRFLANLTEAEIDGSLTRSHMVTTHTVAVETDFWTAMDDLAKTAGNEDDDETAGSGAGHLGDRPQTSGVYACSCAVDLGQLSTNLGEDGDVSKAVRTFLQALIMAPRGKGYIHQFNHRSLPNLLIAELTETCPLNCVGAFEGPINRSKEKGYLPASIKQLDTWWNNQNSLLAGLVESETWAVVEPTLHGQLTHLQPHLEPNYAALIDKLLVQLEG